MAVAERARAFGMRLIVVAKPGRNPALLTQLEALGARQVAHLSDLVALSDIVTFHVPASPDTIGMIGEDLLADVRPGTILINTSRGDTIDEVALLAAIDEKDLWVGLDVYPHEPALGKDEFKSALASHPRVYGTHHIGASTRQAQEAVGDGVVVILEAFIAGDEVPNVVNLAPAGLSRATLVVRHRNRVGVLRDVLSVLRGAGLNIEDMANRIFAGGNAAIATIHVGGNLSEAVIGDVAATTNVLSVSVSP